MNKADTPYRRLFSELRRRQIFRTAALYIVGTWLVLQVADVVFPAMDIPERAIRYLLVAAVLGFPAALVFGWFYDVGVHGIRRTGPAGAAELAAVQPLRRSDYLILTALVGVVGVILYSAVDSVIELPREVREAPREGPPMVAVLPFASSGLAGDSEFFAAGVHDDLLTQLAKLQSIRVISRTSVMEYRNIARNMREIGQALGADALLEGRVQIADDRIRINAQLIDARTDGHLWADTYDAELSPANIFDVQSNIARAIAAALDATLTVQDSQQLTLIPTENMAAYRAYHRAMQFRDSDGNVGSPKYRLALEEAVALDPTFSRAWAELVTNFAYLNFSGGNPEFTQRAEQALQSLQAIAPESADYRIGQAAYVYYALKDYDRAHDIISQALMMSPSDVYAVELRSWIERRQGDFDAYLESKRELRTLDPRNPHWTGDVLAALLITHRYDEAWAEIESSRLESSSTGFVGGLLAFREHRDLKRWQESVDKLCRLYEEEDCEWDARVANRDYLGALDSLGPMEDYEFQYQGLSGKERRRIFTYWLMNEDALPADGLKQWQSQLETDRDDSGDFRMSRSYIGSAILAGAQGNADEAERLIQRWLRREPIDWAERSGSRHSACRVLGMIAATPATVKCIRDGLEEASYVMPFMEPYLPYYDSLRDKPEFIKLLLDIDGEAPATTVH